MEEICTNQTCTTEAAVKPWHRNRKKKSSSTIHRIAIADDSLHHCLSQLALADVLAYARAKMVCKWWRDATNVDHLPLPTGSSICLLPLFPSNVKREPSLEPLLCRLSLRPLFPLSLMHQNCSVSALQLCSHARL